MNQRARCACGACVLRHMAMNMSRITARMHRGTRGLEATPARSSSRDATTRNATCASALDEIRTHIDLHFAQPITLAELTDLIGWSRRRLTTAFARHTGRTIHHYLTEVRLHHAVALIEAGVKIEAVSLLVGYRSKKNFYRAFKARYGMPPARLAEARERR